MIAAQGAALQNHIAQSDAEQWKQGRLPGATWCTAKWCDAFSYALRSDAVQSSTKSCNAKSEIAILYAGQKKHMGDKKQFCQPPSPSLSGKDPDTVQMIPLPKSVRLQIFANCDNANFQLQSAANKYHASESFQLHHLANIVQLRCCSSETLQLPW